MSLAIQKVLVISHHLRRQQIIQINQPVAEFPPNQSGTFSSGKYSLSPPGPRK